MCVTLLLVSLVFASLFGLFYVCFAPLLGQNMAQVDARHVRRLQCHRPQSSSSSVDIIPFRRRRRRRRLLFVSRRRASVGRSVVASLLPVSVGSHVLASCLHRRVRRRRRCRRRRRRQSSCRRPRCGAHQGQLARTVVVVVVVVFVAVVVVVLVVARRPRNV